MSESDPQKIHAARRQQKIDAARGCLVALVFELAALMAGVLWIIGHVTELQALATAGLFAFFAFTLAALVVGVVLLVVGNSRGERKLRDDAAAADEQQQQPEQK